MAGIQDFISYDEDFIGPSVTFPTSADPATAWLVADTSASGTPTYVRNASNAVLTLVSTSEVENVCLYHGDALSFTNGQILGVEMRVKIGASTFTSGSELVFGVGSARNDTTDSVAVNAWFKMVGASSTTALYVESDDTVVDKDDIATGQTLGTTFKRFHIDMSNKYSVKFYVDGVRVASSTTFDMSNSTSGLQPIIQLQKAANTNVDSVSIDYVKIIARR